MLTQKQYELLILIDKCLNDTGVSPSYDEMKGKLNLKSKSGIHRLIKGLEERGFIRRLPHRARALEVIKLPENLSGKVTGSVQEGFTPNVIRGAFRMSATEVIDSDETVKLPLYGKIAAGVPIEAMRDNSSFIDIPASMLGAGEHYALNVEGDSMVDAGILDGDTVLICRGNTAENGAIVVAFVEEQEVTLKRLRRKGDSIALEPANKNYKTRIFGPDQIEVQGSVIGLFRKY